MRNIYTITSEQLEKLGIENPYNDSKKVFAIQNGWSGIFEGFYATIEKNGFDYDMDIMNVKDLTEEQENFITSKCEWIEIY